MSARLVRPRRGDLEAATQPHAFRLSGEYAGRSNAEICDLCGLAQRGTWIHPVCSCGRPFPEDGGAEGVCECCSGCGGEP